MPNALLTREPIHPQEEDIHGGITLPWRAKRRHLAAGCRLWGSVDPREGGDPRLVVAADCLEDESDLVTAFRPLAGWFDMEAAHVGSWSISAMLTRVSHARLPVITPDPHAVLVPDWERIPRASGPEDAVYVAHLAAGPTEFRLLWDRRGVSALPGLSWRRDGHRGVVPTRAAWAPQRADRAAWWDWLYVRSARLALRQSEQRLSLVALDYLVLPGLPWRTA